MANQRSNTISVLLNDLFADWETGFFSASARDFFGAEVLHFSPRGGTVESEGGLRVTPAGAFEDVDATGSTALIICGSQKWSGPGATDISDLLKQAEQAGVPIGAICAGTLAAARAGLLDDRAHTSNGLPWLKEQVPTYRGADRYRDVNDAVTDRGVVTAPASAPASFAIALLELVYPGHKNLAQTKQMLARAR
jgi:putative intracellular protease/amidase